MNKLKYDGEKAPQSLVDGINAKLNANVEEIIQREGKLYRLGDLLKTIGIEKIQAGRIQFRNLNQAKVPVSVEDIVRSWWNVKRDYQGVDIENMFYSKYNRKNPFRVEISLERENGPEGALVYSYRRWLVVPYMPEVSHIERYELVTDDFLPKYSLIAFRPADSRADHAYFLLNSEYDYAPIRFLLYNEYNRPGRCRLMISKNFPSYFNYFILSDDISNKWSFLIPGLFESHLV